jgi:glutathione S-transferase
MDRSPEAEFTFMMLFGSSFSPFVRKVMVYATEKGIELPVTPIGIGSPDPEFRRASPLGKMPALSDGNFSIADSTAIIAYLEAKYPDAPLYPAQPEPRAKSVWFEEFADTVLSQIVFKCFFNRIVAPIFLKQTGDEAIAVEGETQDLPRLLDYLESVAPAPDGFLAGNTLSVGDIAVASMFVNFEHARCAVDRSLYPRTYGWVDAIHARPSFAGIIAKEKRAPCWCRLQDSNL